MNDVVRLKHGAIQGAIVEGIAVFKALPYATPPLGPLRFLPPMPVESWSGVRDATSYRGRAPQAGLRSATRPELEDFSGAPDTSPDSEDCLTLHVWTPAVGPGTSKAQIK